MVETGPSYMVTAILKTADGMHRTGIMDDAAYEKITLRHLSLPTDAALALLNVIRRRGTKVVL